ncbi:MAG TPA: aminoacetone oxidase family FAD-binding enzyme, partial [Spirochaetota bacterium]|nr:aminoacetone oxidase family FAD-binding enzyme [Spirochaetota bacterium]
MKKNYDTIITGAGPAGLFCAITASERERRILVLEKNLTAGKKLLLSGSGQCNFTHSGDLSEFIKHYGDAKNFVKPALYAFSNSELVSFFENNGIKTVTRPDGKNFPASMKADHILALLLNLCAKNSVEIKYSSPVKSVSHNNGIFSVHAGGGNYTCRNFVIASGGSSYPATGSTGDGFRLAESLGHKITDPTPALTPLFIKNYRLGSLSGISVKKSRITVFHDNKKISEGCGDILFTPKGLSGPGILDISRDVTVGDRITISLTEKNEQQCETLFTEILRSEGKKSIRNILKIFDMPERLADALLENASI